MDFQKLSSLLPTRTKLYRFCNYGQGNDWYDNYIELCCNIVQYCQETGLDSVSEFLNDKPEFNTFAKSIIAPIEPLIEFANNGIYIPDMSRDKVACLVLIAVFHRDAYRNANNPELVMDFVDAARQVVSSHFNDWG